MQNGIPVSINVASLALNSSIIVAGTSEGIYISNDDGNSWSLRDTGITYTNIFSVAVSETNMYAGTAGSGVYQSTDSGMTWLSSNTGLTNESVNKIVFDGTSIYSLTPNGFYSSNDHGNTWTPKNNGLSGHNFVSMTLSGADLFIGNEDYPGTGLFKSSDYGNTWTNSGFVNERVVSLYTFNNRIFASISRPLHSFYESMDNGLNWSLKDTGMGNNSIIAITSIGNNIIAGARNDIFLSSDSANNWNSIYNNNLPSNPYRLSHSLLVRDSLLFLGTWGDGIYSSSDNGLTWVCKNLNNTGLNFVYDMAISGDIIFVGTAYGVYYSSDNGDTWTPASEGLVDYFTLNYSRAARCLAIDSTYIYAGVGSSSIFRRPLIDFGITTNTDSHIVSPAVSVFPNPTSNNFNIVSSSEFQLIEIFNTLGAKMYSDKLSSRSKKVITQNFPSGIYVIRISVGNQIVTRKLIIE